MDNKLKCYPVMLPAKITAPTEVGRYITALSYRQAHHNISAQYRYEKYFDSMEVSDAQHLYLVSDREIKEGDYFYNPSTKEILFASKEMLSWNQDTTQKHKGWQSLESTTDPSLGIPLIPHSFIEEWVAKEGKIKSVYIQLYHREGQELVSSPYNEVIILPVKDSWSREEIKRINEAYDEYIDDMSITDVNAMDFDEWFDKNY